MKKLLIIIFIIFTSSVDAQCAMCKAVVESSNASEAEGLNTGILYLMIFPYLLVGALFYFIIKSRRKKKI
ncbi:hypothetical protein [Lutibacter sp.]